MPRRRRRRTSLGAIAFFAIVASAASSGAGSPPGKSPPVLRTPPSIAGVAVEGKTLTADPGEWSGRVKKYAFYWARCDAGGGACSPISEARGVTFVLSATDVGKTLRVTVIATNKNGSTVATSAPSGVVASAAPAPPPPPPSAPAPPPAPPETVLTSVVCGATGTASCRDGNNNGGESILVTYSITNADSSEIQLGAGQPWKPLGASPAGSWVDASCSPITISVRAKRSSDGAVDASPASQALTVTPYAGCASAPPPPPPTTDVPPPPTDVLAKSGFEAAVSLASNDDWNDWQWLSGVDQNTGFDWTNKHLWGSPWPWGVLSIVCGSSPCPTGVPSDYVTSTIETVTGYSGQSTRALKLHSKKPNPNLCCQQVGFGNSELNLSSSASRDYYMRARWKFNPDIQAQATSLGNKYWRSTWEYKTYSRNRIQVLVENHYGYVTWFVQSDDLGATASGVRTIYWAEDTTVRVPIDRWFTIEIAYHRAPDSTGRFFLGVDGKAVVDHRGPTMGSASWEEVNNMVHAIVYTSNKLPGYVLVDDLEVRNGPPCATLPCAASQ